MSEIIYRADTESESGEGDIARKCQNIHKGEGAVAVHVSGQNEAFYGVREEKQRK